MKTLEQEIQENKIQLKVDILEWLCMASGIIIFTLVFLLVNNWLFPALVMYPLAFGIRFALTFTLTRYIASRIAKWYNRKLHTY